MHAILEATTPYSKFGYACPLYVSSLFPLSKGIYVRAGNEDSGPKKTFLCRRGMGFWLILFAQ